MAPRAAAVAEPATMSYGRRECAPIGYADDLVLLHTARGGEATIFPNGVVRLHSLMPPGHVQEDGAATGARGGVKMRVRAAVQVV